MGEVFRVLVCLQNRDQLVLPLRRRLLIHLAATLLQAFNNAHAAVGGARAHIVVLVFALGVVPAKAELGRSLVDWARLVLRQRVKLLFVFVFGVVELLPILVAEERLVIFAVLGGIFATN